MNVTVFGATGSVDTHVVDALRSHRHHVTAYVRTPGEVPASRSSEDVTVVTGELSDADTVDQAVQGADAVVSALGPRVDRTSIGLPLVAGTHNIVNAMHRYGVRRYVGHGTPSVLDPQETGTWQTLLPTLVAWTFRRRAYDEITGMSQVVTTSGLDWTIVRFLALQDGPPRGTVREGFYGADKLGVTVTRADLGAFTAAQVDDARYVGRAPAISG